MQNRKTAHLRRDTQKPSKMRFFTHSQAYSNRYRAKLQYVFKKYLNFVIFYKEAEYGTIKRNYLTKIFLILPNPPAFSIILGNLQTWIFCEYSDKKRC